MPLSQRVHDAIGPLTAKSVGANSVAGLVASLVTIAYCVSFSALLFQGDLRSGLAMGLWGLLVGSAIAGIYVSLTTSLPPAEAAPDNPAVAVLSVLAATVSAPILAAGGGADRAVLHVLLAFSLATLATGAVLYLLGAFRLAQSVRFVPYPVIGGFLAASGWFLITGGIEVVTGRDLTFATLDDALTAASAPKVLLGASFAFTVFALKQRLGSYVLPLAFFGGAVVLDLILWSQGLMHAGSGWYIAGAAHPLPWVPALAVAAGDVDWPVLFGATAEIAAVAGVTVLALLLDVTGLEVARGRTADLDHEFRINGAANVIAAPLGGLMGNLSMNGSRLLDETGGAQRISGAFASLVIVLVVLTGIDLPALIPAPILAGLLIYLGIVVLTAVLLNSPSHRAWTDFALALLIMVAIVQFGYLTGVVLGFIAACLMFAFSYSRVAVIRRHLTRAEFSSNVDRAPAANHQLLEHGDRIHIFWLSGFIFFGSSNGVLEEIRDALVSAGKQARRFAVLDVADVSGFDTSAMLSLVKLRNHCAEAGVTLVFAGASPGLQASLKHAGVLGAEEPHRSFASRNDAIEWCEEKILKAEAAGLSGERASDLTGWLTDELGSEDRARRMASYFDRRELPPGTALYNQNSPSDTIDLVVAGSVAVVVKGETGLPLLIRRMSRKTVVGEMGFFRGNPRRATVSVEGESLVYTLTRASYDRLCAEDPALAAAFLEFIVRALADRLEFANRGIAALS
ncbi:MAG: SulP family inorganic anion transporter [Hyphomicrobiaceae bacterium]|nr:SulP family inorganic anion transporter [Hyphomicrobiaceae bacterium]